MPRYPAPLDRLPPSIAASLIGGGGAAGIAPSAGFSIADYSDGTGKHLQRSTAWTLPAVGTLLWYGSVDAINTGVGNAVSGFLIGNIGSSTAFAGAYLAIDSTKRLVTFGRRKAAGGGGATLLQYTSATDLDDSTPRLWWATWNHTGRDACEVGTGHPDDGDFVSLDGEPMKTGGGNSPSFLARNTSVVGNGSTACTQAWAALMGRRPTDEEWEQLAGGNLDALRGASSINFGILPASSGDITDPADVEDIGTDGGDWNDATRGTGAVEVQGVGL